MFAISLELLYNIVKLKSFIEYLVLIQKFDVEYNYSSIKIGQLVKRLYFKKLVKTKSEPDLMKMLLMPMNCGAILCIDGFVNIFVSKRSRTL